MAADEIDAGTPVGHTDLTGTTVGRFVIHARLGAGGMGEVYRAEDLQLRRTVAIKRLAPGQNGSPSVGRALITEAQRASALNHPGIASVYDVFEEHDEFFLVMEYVDGITLRDRLRGPLDVDAFCAIASQCVAALGAAHLRGILHGDVKPANIMLTGESGSVKICDFGLARRVLPSGADIDSLQTTTQPPPGVAGTPAYMAPEVALQRSIDVRADIFSLGVVFYEMLAGRNPFTAGNGMTTLDRILHHAPEPVERLNPGVTQRLSRVVQRMIEKAPERRYATIADVGRDLAAVQTELLAASRRRHLVSRVALPAGAAALALVAVLAWPGFRAWQRTPASSGTLPENIHLAVLPFVESAAAGDRQFFTQGFTEALNASLSRLTLHRRLQVASPTDLRARGVTTPAEAREQLGANVALNGSLASAGDRVEVTAVLTDTRTGRPLRSAVASSATASPLAVQDLVVETVVRMMGLTLSADERRALLAHDTAQPGAYDFYLQARGYLLNYDRLESLDSAIAVFRRALEVDRRYALAYAGLGQAYWRKHELTGSSAWVEPARAACEGALGIDPNLAEPHACLGMVLNGTGDYEKAAAEYEQALTLEPTDDVLYLGLATAYEKLGRPADAERSYRRAIELRPYYWGGYSTLGAYYYRAGRFDEALRMFQQVVDLAPDSFRGYSSLGATYFMKDETAPAIAAFEKSLAVRPNYAAASNLGTLLFFEGQFTRAADMFHQALSLEKGSYQVWTNLAAALEQSGSANEAAAAHREARRLVEEQLSVNPRDAALHLNLADHLYALGDKAASQASLRRALALNPTEAHTLFQLAAFYEYRLHQRSDAISWLEKAVAAGQTWREIDRSPGLKELRQDPRFKQLRGAR